MKVSGTAELEGEPSEAFRRLLDPWVLLRCIPGCESMEEVATGEYTTRIRAGVGPVKGTFEGTVTLSDLECPARYRMRVVGRSTVGHVDGEAQITLEPAGERTLVRYEGQARISGLLASVGNRLIEVAARKVVRQFFDRLTGELARKQ